MLFVPYGDSTQRGLCPPVPPPGGAPPPRSVPCEVPEPPEPPPTAVLLCCVTTLLPKMTLGVYRYTVMCTVRLTVVVMGPPAMTVAVAAYRTLQFTIGMPPLKLGPDVAFLPPCGSPMTTHEPPRIASPLADVGKDDSAHASATS